MIEQNIEIVHVFHLPHLSIVLKIFHLTINVHSLYTLFNVCRYMIVRNINILYSEHDVTEGVGRERELVELFESITICVCFHI